MDVQSQATRPKRGKPFVLAESRTPIKTARRIHQIDIAETIVDSSQKSDSARRTFSADRFTVKTLCIIYGAKRSGRESQIRSIQIRTGIIEDIDTGLYVQIMMFETSIIGEISTHVVVHALTPIREKRSRRKVADTQYLCVFLRLRVQKAIRSSNDLGQTQLCLEQQVIRDIPVN